MYYVHLKELSYTTIVTCVIHYNCHMCHTLQVSHVVLWNACQQYGMKYVHHNCTMSYWFTSRGWDTLHTVCLCHSYCFSINYRASFYSSLSWHSGDFMEYALSGIWFRQIYIQTNTQTDKQTERKTHAGILKHSENWLPVELSRFLPSPLDFHSGVW